MEEALGHRAAVEDGEAARAGGVEDGGGAVGVAHPAELRGDLVQGLVPADLLEPSAVARVSLVPDAGVTRDPLFGQVLDRRTNKLAYDSARPVDPAQVTALLDAARRRPVLADAVVGPGPRDELRRICREANAIEVTTARTYLESARLFRMGPSEIERHRDGIPLNATMVRALDALGLFSRTEVPVRGSSLYARVMDRWAAFETGAGFVWIASPADRRAAQIEAGRAFVRMQLAATRLGVGVHPLSQALQEFPEVAAQRAAVHRALGFELDRFTIQMLARIGHAPPTQPAPRRGVEAIVQSA